MTMPWEKYAQPQTAAAPWTKYAAAPAKRGSDIGYDQFAGDPTALSSGEDTLRELKPGSVTDRILNATGAVADKMMIGGGDEALAGVYALGAMIPGGRSPGEAFQQELERLQQKRGEFEFTNPKTATAANVAGTILSPANVVGGEYMTGAATFPGKVLRGAGVGGGYGGASGFLSTDGDVKQRGLGAAYGAGIGAAAGGVAAPVTSFVRPNIRPEVQDLINRGVSMTPGQMAGGAFQRLEEKAASVPLLGDAIKAAQNRSIDDFNRAAYNEVLAPIGGTFKGEPGRDAINAIADQVSHEYQAILPHLTFTPDQQFSADVAALVARSKVMPKSLRKQFSKLLQDDIGPRLAANGTMNGETFKGLESELSKQARGYMSDASYDQRRYGELISDLNTAFREALERGNPTHAPQLKKINSAFARLVRVERAAGAQGSKNGRFTPEQFQAAVRATDNTSRKSGFARGTALMQDLSEPGINVLGRSYPDSGTAGRLLIPALLGGSATFGGPKAFLAAAALAAPYTRTGSQLLQTLIARRPQNAAALRRLLERATPALGSGSGQIGAGLMEIQP